MRHEKAILLLQLARQLAGSAEGLTLEEMARACGGVRRTAERLRDALETLFPQMEVLPDGATKRYRIPGGLDGFLQAPTTEELTELTKAVATLCAGGHHVGASALERLEQRVRVATRSKVLARLAPDVEALARAELSVVRAGPRPHEDPDIFATVRHAIKALVAVQFRYMGGSRPGDMRVICPHGLLMERTNYLVGSELGGTELRTWRLDRIRDIELTKVHAAPDPSFNLSDFANRSFGIYHDHIEQVELRILPDSAEEARAWRFHATQVLKDCPDGSVHVSFQASGMLELAWHLFSWGDKIQILSPERLKVAMRNAVADCLRHLDSPATDSVAGPS